MVKSRKSQWVLARIPTDFFFFKKLIMHSVPPKCVLAGNECETCYLW